jgi:hypothetical protein
MATAARNALDVDLQRILFAGPKPLRFDLPERVEHVPLVVRTDQAPDGIHHDRGVVDLALARDRLEHSRHQSHPVSSRELGQRRHEAPIERLSRSVEVGGFLAKIAHRRFGKHDKTGTRIRRLSGQRGDSLEVGRLAHPGAELRYRDPHLPSIDPSIVQQEARPLVPESVRRLGAAFNSIDGASRT